VSDKIMVVFAGPNGSGKSTIVKNALAMGHCPQDFICPDNYVVEHEKNDVQAYIKAMQEAETQREIRLALGKSFAFETVLSTHEKLEFIRKAKWLGYKVHVVYVTTDDPQINIARVQSRVAQGGHDVPVDKILSRYARAMNLMYDVMCAADETIFYDNSSDKPELVAVQQNVMFGEQQILPLRSSAWFEKHVLSKARERVMVIGNLTHNSTAPE